MNITKTYSTRPSQVEPQWHVFDATDKILGRLATEVSVLLQGKHKPSYARHILTGDFVIVVNASKIRVTGNKLEQKFYRSHSGYPGGLRQTPMFEVQDAHPDRIIRAAVRGMLPKNILARQMLRRLKIYSGSTHPHGAQIKELAKEEIVVVQPRRESPARIEVEETAQPLDALVEEATQIETAEAEQIEETTAEAEEVEQPTKEKQEN